MQINEVVLIKFDRNNSPIKRRFLMNRNILYIALQLVSSRHVHTIQYYFFSLNTYEYNSIIIYTKIIDISIKPYFFILFVDQSLETFPKHNRLVTISESFALNL